MSGVTMKDILVAVKELSGETKVIRKTVEQTEIRVTNIEDRITNIEERVTGIESEMKDIRRDIRKLDQKVTIFSESLIDTKVDLSILQEKVN